VFDSRVICERLSTRVVVNFGARDVEVLLKRARLGHRLLRAVDTIPVRLVAAVKNGLRPCQDIGLEGLGEGLDELKTDAKRCQVGSEDRQLVQVEGTKLTLVHAFHQDCWLTAGE